jgi:hypothetical protein
MLELKVVWENQEYVLQFEHSLRSLSKWESKHKKPFQASREKLPSEMIDYFQCMLMTPGVDPSLVYACNPQQLDALANYINESFTASTVPEDRSGMNDEVITSELIYFWMTALKINWEAQDWHLSRLMMLIQITSFKQQPPKKRRVGEVMTDWRKENERRRQLYNTSG